MNYQHVKLGEICDFLYGKGLPEAQRKSGATPVYGSNGIVGWHDQAVTKGKTIILGRKGSIGEVHFSKLPCWPIDTTYYLEATKRPCDLNWLYYMLVALDLTQLNKSAAIPGLNRDDAYEKEIPFPAPSEQKRISSILEKADRLRRQRHYALELSSTYLQSVFLEMFGDPESNPKGWEIEHLGNRIAFITSGSRGWAQYYSNKGAIFLRIQNVGINQLLLDDLAYVQVSNTAEGRRTQVRGGDLLLSITADLGRTAVIPENFPDAYINQHLALLRLKDLNPVFVAEFISTPGGKAQIMQLDRAGVKSGLNFDDIRGFKIFVPPSPLQQKFAQIVQKFERLRAQQWEAERQAEHLFQTLLHQAFQGNVDLEPGIIADVAVEGHVQPSDIDSRITGDYVQLQLKY